MNMTPISTITSGTVAVEDGVKAKEDFAPARKVKVELSFAVPEGSDGTLFLDGIAQIADNKVREMLGRPTVAYQRPEVLAPTAPVAEKVETAKPETAAAKKKREAAEAKAAEAAKPERTKADLEREAGLPVTHKAPSDDELLNDEPTITAAGKVVEEPKDELDDLLGDAAPAPITDLELGKAAQEKNAKMKAEFGEAWAPAKIRTLIATFAGEGKRINDIPVAKRKDFMAQLAALK